MFEWKVEEMALMKEKNVAVYSCESSVSREDKSSFID